MDLLASSAFAERVGSLMEEWHAPGVAIAIVDDGKFASRAFGHASLEDKTPMTTDTISNIASCSKSLTAGLLGIAIAEKDSPDFRWDTTVTSLLPGEFVMSDEKYTEAINIDDIVSHRTGFPEWDRSLFGPRSGQADTPKSITNNLRNFPVNAPLRTTYQYNNLMFSVAAYIHERQTGLSFSEGLRDKIFQPLGMNSSFVHISGVPSHLRSKAAIGYNWVKDEGYRASEPIDQPEGEGAGCILTSVDDHVRWIDALIRQVALITPDIRRELLRPRVIDVAWDNSRHPFTSKDLYAAGWWVRHYRGHEIVLHTGCDVGFGSYAFFLPGLKVGGVIHGNSEEASDMAPVIGHMLVDEAIGVPQDERPDWNSILSTEYVDEDAKKDEEPREKEAQPRPLEAYVGTYWHPGFKNMKVEIKADRLFIDASTRCYPFDLTLEHISAGTDYEAMLNTPEGTKDTIDAKFELEGERVVKMGLDLGEIGVLSWFERARE